MKFKEDKLQVSVAKYLDCKKVVWCHVANERKTSFQAGKRMKSKGVKSGVPDCLIFNSNNTYNGLAIELKIKPNKATANQIEWLNKLKKEGWCIGVCYSFEEARKLIDDYLKVPKRYS